MKISVIYNTKAGIIYDEQNELQTYCRGYILQYISPNLKWWERDGLLIYCDQLKYQEFTANNEKCFSNHKVISFDIIHNQCRGNKRNKSIRGHKTVAEKDFKYFPEKDELETISSSCRVNRPDLFLEKQLANEFYYIFYIDFLVIRKKWTLVIFWHVNNQRAQNNRNRHFFLRFEW